MLKISDKLNPYLADLAVFFIKYHDIHWNVQGKMFVQIHQYTEGRYDDAAEKLDEIAELIIMHGEKPAASLSKYLSLASIKELDQGSYRDEEVLKILEADIAHLKSEAEDIRKAMAEEDIFDIVAVLEGHIAGYSKELWFLRSMMA